MSFLNKGTALGGAVSDDFSFNPPKPFLLYALLSINHISLHTLIDTGASATCISHKALQRMSTVRYVDKTPRSFVLADGVMPLQVKGLVELSMEFDNEIIKFYALVTKKLCIDLILGMDFMISYSANIDVKRQLLSLEVADRRLSIHLDDQYRRPLVPLHSCSASTIPPHSTAMILVSSPFSSLSAYFVPTATFLEHPHLSSSQKTMTIQQHHSFIRIINTSNSPQHIPQYFCFGYFLSTHAESQTFSERIAALCHHYNEKKNRQFRDATLIHLQLPQRLPTNFNKSPQSRDTTFTAIISSIPPSPSFHLQQTRDLLVKHLLDPTHRTTLSNLLSQFPQLFDNSRHNISNIIIENVFNTVPHTPPAFRPHRNPHTQQETQRLIEQFLEAGIIQESNSPYAAPAFIVPRKDNRPGRLVVDYRALNRITIPDASPLPHGEDLLQELGKGYRYFSKLDLKCGYHQFRIPSVDRPKTAFVVSQGHYEFCVLSMGPQNAPAAFQKIMCKIMKPCRDFCHVFLDDIVLCSVSVQ